MLWMVCGLLLASQDTAAEDELVTAVRTTIARGFTYVVKPVAAIPDGFPRDREALAGVEVRGRYSNGIALATDGEHDIVRNGARVAAKTSRGWLPLDLATSSLRQEVLQAFDPDDSRYWRRGNLTAGRKALEELIRFSHLANRADIARLTALGRDFRDLRKSRQAPIDGAPSTVYEGDLTDLAALELLQGPFDALVQRGTLSFRNVSGVGRAFLQNGVVRRVHLKVAGAYGYYEESENVRRKGLCTLEVVADITKVGETQIVLPKEAARLMEE